MSKMLCIGSQVLAQENIQGQIPGHNTNDKEAPCRRLFYRQSATSSGDQAVSLLN